MRTQITRHAFSQAAAIVWNNLSLDSRSGETYERFRSATKKRFYELAFTNSSRDRLRSHDSLFSNELWSVTKMRMITRHAVCADFPNVVAECHIWGAHPEGYDPQLRTRPRFLYNAPTLPKFHHPMFTRSEVIVLTNKQQTPLKTSNAFRYATPFGNKAFIDIRLSPGIVTPLLAGYSRLRFRFPRIAIRPTTAKRVVIHKTGST